MEHHQQPATLFIANNPGSTKTQIGEALGLKGLSLFNLLRWLERDGFITSEGKGDDKLYYAAAPTAESEAVQPEASDDTTALAAAAEETVVEEANEANEENLTTEVEAETTTEESVTPGSEAIEVLQVPTEQTEEPQATVTDVEETQETEDQQPPLGSKQWQAPVANEEPAAVVDNPITEQTEKKAAPSYTLHKSRDNSSYRFNGQTYGKGPLVRAIVTHYVSEYPHISLEGLKEAFPDSLLKRFGIFQEIETAKRIANGGPRYFYKEDQQIRLSDAVVVVCSQFTKENIQPFLKKAAELDYEITTE